MPIFAHSMAGPEERWEPLADHLEQVAGRAAAFAGRFDAELLARAAGLLHDIGKCSAEYQDYIRGRGPSPDHSTAGAVEAVRRYGHVAQGLVGRLLAFAIAGHHAGLADGTGNRGSTLEARLAKLDLPSYAGWAAHVGALPEQPCFRFASAHDPRYSIMFLGRMLFSCLVDADFLATEAFYAKAEGRTVERGGHAPLELLRQRLDSHLSTLAAERRGTSPLNDLRADILAHARAKAACPPGLFTMTVPTGGGKTLASLAFALDHAVRHGLDRVIYVIPYTSIIEQTAGIFRNVLGADDVLEHHGNVDWERAPLDTVGAADAEGPAGLHKLRRAAENWDVPVIVTTAVQFFESLHAARPSRCRKLHNLARSVVILDEAQTLPVHLLRPCVAAIKELSANYGASLVLCTATQPALRKADGFEDGLDIGAEHELAPDPQRLYEALRRVEVRHAGTVADDVVAARFAGQPQMLCIVNSRKHAQALFAAIADLPGARHLTTLMCPAHRRAVLAEVRKDLAAGRPVRLVSTSLIEAGVDIDLPEVWRAEAGLESIAQAAGRCNREGKLAKGRMVIFASADHRTPTAFRQPIEAMGEALRRHPGDPLGLDAVHTYFTELYWTKGDKLDEAKLDGAPFPILPAIRERGCAPFAFPYASIAEAFHIIDDTMDPVIVPWQGGPDPDEVQSLLRQLRAADRPPAKVLRRLQQFTVSIPSATRARMLGSGAVQPVSADYGDRFVVLVTANLYSESVGLSLDEFGMSAEAGII